MINQYSKPKALDGINITSVHIKSEHEFAFIGQKPQSDDPWQHIPTFIIFCDTHKQGEDRWDVQELDYLTGAGNLIGCYSEQPQPAWVFGFNSVIQDGKESMLIFSTDGQLIARDRIPDHTSLGRTLISSFRSLKAVNNGFVYAVSGHRNVYRRDSIGKWKHLSDGIPQLDYYKGQKRDSTHGFDVIDGFADNDLYACGGKADLWHYDGQQWQALKLPTTDYLENICCGGGKVYIITNTNRVIEGRNDQWQVIDQDITDNGFEKMAWYRDRCYITTLSGLYEVNNGVFAKAKIAEGYPGSFLHIDARGDTLLCACLDSEISYYDGKEWHQLVYRDRPPKDPKQPTLLEITKAWQKENK